MVEIDQRVELSVVWGLIEAKVLGAELRSALAIITGRVPLGDSELDSQRAEELAGLPRRATQLPRARGRALRADLQDLARAAPGRRRTLPPRDQSPGRPHRGPPRPRAANLPRPQGRNDAHLLNGMEDQLEALGLVLNCVVLWNTDYMDHALTELRTQHYPVEEADTARLSPFIRSHIGIDGHYSFHLPDLSGGHRPLCDPDTDE